MILREVSDDDKLSRRTAMEGGVRDYHGYYRFLSMDRTIRIKARIDVRLRHDLNLSEGIWGIIAFIILSYLIRVDFF